MEQTLVLGSIVQSQARFSNEPISVLGHVVAISNGVPFGSPDAKWNDSTQAHLANGDGHSDRSHAESRARFGHVDCYALTMSSYSHAAYLAAKASSTRAGRVLRDTWLLRELLGLGRGTAVYSATHRDGTSCAIKLLASDSTVDAARVLTELRALESAWAHPSAVAFRDAGVTGDGILYLTMELLKGETLLQHVERVDAPTDLRYALRVISQLLEVLSVAHSNRVLHQALNMNNVFITREGELKLLDLGIVRLLEFGAPGLAMRTQYSLGTPDFMPPEQALGLASEIDATSDVWAVGAILFRMLTGSPVHGHGRDATRRILSAAGRFAPPLASVLSGATPELCLLVDRALTFNKRDRWFDADAMRCALVRLFGPQSQRLGDRPVSLPAKFRERTHQPAHDDDITQV